MISQMMLRALLLCSGALCPLLLYEYVHHKYYKTKQVPLPLGFLLLLCLLAFRVGSAYAGAFTALILFPAGDRAAGRAIALIGLLAGLWSAAVLLQLAQNAVRRALGEPTLPISLVRLSGKSRGHRI